MMEVGSDFALPGRNLVKQGNIKAMLIGMVVCEV